MNHSSLIERVYLFSATIHSSKAPSDERRSAIFQVRTEIRLKLVEPDARDSVSPRLDSALLEISRASLIASVAGTATLCFRRAFSRDEGKREQSPSSWRPRCGRRLREEAPSHTASRRAPSNKTLSGHLRSRPSGASLIFPTFCRERGLSSPLLSVPHPSPRTVLSRDRTRASVAPFDFLIFVIIKRDLNVNMVKIN